MLKPTIKLYRTLYDHLLLPNKNKRGAIQLMNAPHDSFLPMHQSLNLVLHHHRHPLLRSGHRFRRVLVILQLPGKVGIIRRHIEVAMAAQVE